MDESPQAEGVVAALGEGDRLRVVAALVLGAGSVAGVADATGIPADRVGRALGRLQQIGLVDHDRHGFRFKEEVLRALARGGQRPRLDDDEAEAGQPSGSAVVRAFVKGGRLTAIPSTHSKRLEILDLIAQDFEIGKRYSERRVTEILLRWYPDYAALRRYLVEDGYLERQGGGGSYWRAGGSVEI
ncbi:MAG TPA: DUF2087 domain-containing protein [Acidimicrobiales bacterium]|nr:DUF2087 domain-containing protein [Acidimicrobiales bacterium]